MPASSGPAPGEVRVVVSNRWIASALRGTLLAGAVLAGMPGPVAAEQKDLKIGVIAALSGGGTAWGLGLQRGVQLALDEANAAGGVTVGPDTYKLSIIALDDQYNAAQAKTAADRLVNGEGVKYIFGPVGSPGAMGSLPVTQPAKVLQFVDGYTAAILKNEWHGAYVFRVNNSSLEFSEPIVQWVKQTMPEVKKVGLIGPNDATGQAAIPTLAGYYKKAGFDTWVDYYERGNKEFTPLLLRMMAENVDLFDLNSNAPGEAGLLLKQARQVGFTGTILQAGGAGVDEIVAIAGPLAKGFLKYDVIDEQSPEVKPLVAAYAKKYGGTMNGMVPIYYNATSILLEAMRRAGSIDTTAVRDAVEKLNGWKTPFYGNLVWSGEKVYGVNHQIMLPFYIKEVQGKQAIVKITLQPE
jgi:branched-chain amino acid transport system substrate-binding protein